MNNVYEFRHFDTLRRKAQELGICASHYRALVQRVKEAQENGDTGAHVAGELTALQARLKKAMNSQENP